MYAVGAAESGSFWVVLLPLAPHFDHMGPFGNLVICCYALIGPTLNCCGLFCCRWVNMAGETEWAGQAYTPNTEVQLAS